MRRYFVAVEQEGHAESVRARRALSRIHALTPPTTAATPRVESFFPPTHTFAPCHVFNPRGFNEQGGDGR